MDGDTVTAAEIAVIVNRLDNLGSRMDEQFVTLRRQIEHIARERDADALRITALEKWRAYFIGGAAVGSLALGTGAAWLALAMR